MIVVTVALSGGVAGARTLVVGITSVPQGNLEAGMPAPTAEWAPVLAAWEAYTAGRVGVAPNVAWPAFVSAATATLGVDYLAKITVPLILLLLCQLQQVWRQREGSSEIKFKEAEREASLGQGEIRQG